jgi:hypothetical protein
MDRQPRTKAKFSPGKAKMGPYGRHLFQILVLTGILCSLPVFANAFKLEITPNKIRGSGEKTRLVDVLSHLEGTMDYEIYIDPALVEKTVTFRITEPLSHEAAIKRIVRPYNTAFVYTLERPSNTFRILQIKVLGAGKGASSALLHIASAGPETVAGIEKPNNPYPLSAGALAPGAQMNRGPYGAVKPPFQMRKGALGSTLPIRGDGAKGPDYRLSVHGMRSAYAQVQAEKADLSHRTNRAVNIAAKNKHAAGKSGYRGQRKLALQEYLINKGQ